MEPLVVLAVQCTFSFTIFFLIAKWYLEKRISSQNKFEILAFLLIINVFRYLPLSLYLPGQVSAEFPTHVKDIIAHGDFLSGILAFIALLVVKSKSRFAKPAIWLFSIASIIDMIFALTFAMTYKVYELSLGVNYFIVAVYVPMLMVVQYQIVRIMFSRNYK